VDEAYFCIIKIFPPPLKAITHYSLELLFFDTWSMLRVFVMVVTQELYLCEKF